MPKYIFAVIYAKGALTHNLAHTVQSMLQSNLLRNVILFFIAFSLNHQNLQKINTWNTSRYT